MQSYANIVPSFPGRGDPTPRLTPLCAWRPGGGPQVPRAGTSATLMDYGALTSATLMDYGVLTSTTPHGLRSAEWLIIQT